MIDINKLEEGVLIEANDFNTGISQLVNDIAVQDRRMSRNEIYKLACNIIGSLVVQNYVTVIKTKYKRVDEDIYNKISSSDVSEEEMEIILKHPEKWDEMDVFSKTATIELRITDKGREYLSTL